MRRLLVPLTALSLLGIALAGCKSSAPSTDCNCSPAPTGALSPVPLVMPGSGLPPRMPTIDGMEKAKKAPIEDVPAPQEKATEKDKEKEKEKDVDLPVPPRF